MILSLGALLPVYGQEDEPSPSLLSSEAPSLRFEHLKIEDGLAQGSANFLFQDEQGYMWISTQSGLHRYDGYEFKVYNSTAFDTTSLSDSWAWGIDEDSSGNIWVATERGGLNKMDRTTGTFEHFRHNPNDSTSISSNRVFQPFEDSKGNLWVSTQGNGLNRMMKGEEGKFKRYEHVHDDPNTISSRTMLLIKEDQENNIWITSTNGITRINIDTDQITRFLFNPDAGGQYGAPQNVLDIYHAPDQPGIHWLATGNGLVRLNSHTGEFERYLLEPDDNSDNTPNFLQAIVPDPNIPEVFWVSGPGTGLARFDVRTEKFTSYRHDPTDPNSLAEDYVQSLFADESGTIWVGYTAEGLSAFNPGAVNFSHLRHVPQDASSLSPGIVWGMYEDETGSLWVGTDAGPSINFLTQFSTQDGKTTWHQFDPDDENTILPGNIRVFAEDKSGRFWVGGSVGLNLLDPATGDVKRFRQNNNNQRNSIFYLNPSKSDSNKLWVGSFGGLDLFDTEKQQFTPHLLNDDSTGNEPIVLTVFEDPESEILWIGTASGLIRYDLREHSSQLYTYDPKDTTSVSDDVVFSITQREREPDILWLGTQSSGINRFDTKTGLSTHLTKSEGLPDNHVYGILKDERETLWMSTNNGISNYDPDNNTFRNYGLDDGLIALEYNQNAYFKGQDGVLYFGSGEGVTAFVPEQLQINEVPPKVVLSGLKLFNKPVPVGPDSPLQKSLNETEQITLNYNQNEVSFEFVGLHFANSAKNRYAYQLEGFDKEWVDAGTQRSATYTNLPPQDYTFKVRASNADGVWNNQGASVRMTILPPWYQTWWAYGLFTGLFGFLVFGVDRVQRFRLSKKEEERQALREAELRAEAENKRRADTEQLSQIGRAITSTLLVEKIIETVYEHVNALMDAAIFSVGIYNKDQNTLDFPATKEKGEMLPPHVNKLDEENRLAVWCFKNNKEIIIGEYPNEHKKYLKSYQPPIVGEDPMSIVYLPLVQQDRVIGVITTQSFNKDAYTPYHLNLLRNLATYAANALDNAWAYRKLNATLSELQSMQQQLVQQEKLASLGQLTAGIAHEIKNPLNFVNNFSDLNVELLQEAREMAGENTELKELLGDIEVNLNKIHEHGRRADSIVKSMLQHSRGGSGEKQPTNINNVIREYVNLSFHGMRAGKEPINSDIIFELEENMEPIPLIAEDFSRVIVNLCNNAFDAMRDKSKKAPEDYKPKLTVRSKQADGKTIIEIEDNGPGIPTEIKDQIMQPFFTTKKGTEGTGLGLSITNDIVKAHGGTLEIETNKNEFTRFRVYLT